MITAKGRRISKARIEEIKKEAEALAEKVRRTGIHPEAEIIWTGIHTVRVICPYCKQVHTHGKTGLGYRRPHCYIIDASNLPDYKIVKK